MPDATYSSIGQYKKSLLWLTQVWFFFFFFGQLQPKPKQHKNTDILLILQMWEQTQSGCMACPSVHRESVASLGTESVPDSLWLLVPPDPNWPFTSLQPSIIPHSLPHPPALTQTHLILESDLLFPYLGPDLRSCGERVRQVPQCKTRKVS